jgi:hypothetical protein
MANCIRLAGQGCGKLNMHRNISEISTRKTQKNDLAIDKKHGLKVWHVVILVVKVRRKQRSYQAAN